MVNHQGNIKAGNSL